LGKVVDNIHLRKTKTMTPKEKAKELQNAMYQKIFDIDIGVHTMHDAGRYIASIQCALISVDEILNTMHNEDFGGHVCDEIGAGDYWREVKAIIENL
jgi:hypothetical protein